MIIQITNTSPNIFIIQLYILLEFNTEHLQNIQVYMYQNQIQNQMCKRTMSMSK